MRKVLDVLLIVIYTIIGIQSIKTIVAKKKRKYTTVNRKIW